MLIGWDCSGTLGLFNLKLNFRNGIMSFLVGVLRRHSLTYIFSNKLFFFFCHSSYIVLANYESHVNLIRYIF